MSAIAVPSSSFADKVQAFIGTPLGTASYNSFFRFFPKSVDIVPVRQAGAAEGYANLGEAKDAMRAAPSAQVGAAFVQVDARVVPFHLNASFTLSQADSRGVPFDGPTRIYNAAVLEVLNGSGRTMFAKQ